MTVTQAMPEEQMQYNVAAETFERELRAKYPTLDLNQSVLEAIIAELVELGLWRERISIKAFRAGFANAVSSGKIILPPAEPTITQETIDRIRQKYPVVITKPKELSQKEKNALVGVHDQSGRMTREDREEQNKKIEKNYADQKSEKQWAALRREYLELKSKAETAMGDNPRSHGQTYAIRKEALAKLNSDPRYAAVKD